LPVLATTTLYCEADTLSGRYLFLQIQDPQEYLTLIEVEVYALQSGKCIFLKIIYNNNNNNNEKNKNSTQGRFTDVGRGQLKRTPNGYNELS